MRLIPRSRGGALWRFTLASVLMIVSVAGATAVAGLLQVQNIVDALKLSKGFSVAALSLPAPGQPQTILAIGSDRRANANTFGNTDTMMLVRLDASSSTINVLSVPRDLQVNLPGYGINKLNAAFALGGPKLLVHTLQTQVFPGLVVNHIVVVTFGGFRKLVDAIGCVWGDVDHRYYNNTALTNYSSIDIQPGYQRMCNSDALAFVRFRHTDSDIVRNARQQDFIRWAKDNYGLGQLVANENRLIRIFGKNSEVDTGLQSVDGLINLFNLILNADGHTIKTIPFPYQFGQCNPVCYVYAQSAGAEQAALRAFLTPNRALAAPAGKPPSQHRRHGRGHSSWIVAGLTADPADGRSQAGQVGNIGIPVYYPRLILAGSGYCFSITGNCDDPSEPATEYAHSYPRSYEIDAPGGPYPSYRMTLAVNSAFGWYYGIQGTTWRNPPLLAHPTQTETINGKRLEEFFNGGKLSVVAWRTPTGVYWVSNTLDDHIPNGQLKAIAASLTQ